MRTIYILIGGDGCYSDRNECPLVAYETAEEAHAVRDRATQHVHEADAVRRVHPKGSWSSEALAEWRAFLAPKTAALGIGEPCEDYAVCECYFVSHAPEAT